MLEFEVSKQISYGLLLFVRKFIRFPQNYNRLWFFANFISFLLLVDLYVDGQFQFCLMITSKNCGNCLLKSLSYICPTFPYMQYLLHLLLIIHTGSLHTKSEFFTSLIKLKTLIVLPWVKLETVCNNHFPPSLMKTNLKSKQDRSFWYWQQCGM